MAAIDVFAFVRDQRHSRPRALLAAVVLVGTSGCVHLEQTIQIKPNGAARFTYHYSVAEDTLETIAAGHRTIEGWQGGQPGPGLTDLNWLFNAAAAERHFAGHGIKLKRHRTYTKGGRRHVELALSATDVGRALDSGKFGEFSLTRTETGEFRFHAHLVAEPEPQELTPEQLNRLRALCDDLWLSFSVEVPTRILETTATRVDGKRATWVFDPAQSADFLVQTPVIGLSFSSEGLDWKQ